MMYDFVVDHVDLPINQYRLELLDSDENAVNIGDCIRISFDPGKTSLERSQQSKDCNFE